MITIINGSGESIILDNYGEAVLFTTLSEKLLTHYSRGHVTDKTDSINYCPTCAEIERLIRHLKG